MKSPVSACADSGAFCIKEIFYELRYYFSGVQQLAFPRQGKGAVASGAVYYSLNAPKDTFRKMEMSLEGTTYSDEADTILRFFEVNEGAWRVEAD